MRFRFQTAANNEAPHTLSRTSGNPFPVGMPTPLVHNLLKFFSSIRVNPCFYRLPEEPGRAYCPDWIFRRVATKGGERLYVFR